MQRLVSRSFQAGSIFSWRRTYKVKVPNVKFVSVVGKAGGDRRKSLSEAKKASFVAKAIKRKTEYERT